MIANLGSIKVILFDLGNTLIYFDGPVPQLFEAADAALVRRLNISGFALDETAFIQTFRQRLDLYYQQRETEFIEYTVAYIVRDLLREYGYPQVDPGHLKPALEDMYAITRQYWQPEEDALPVVETLQARGYRMALISNAGDDDDVQALVDKAGLRPYLEVIQTSAALGIRKPNPYIFKTVLKHMGVSPAQAVMVGDTLGADILGAHNAGLPGIWISRRADRAANRAHLETILPDLEITALSDLSSLFI